MKLRNVIWVIAAALSVSSALQAQTCSMGAVAGTYSLSCSGWVTVAAPATVLPAVVMGTLTVAPDGSAAATYTQSLAGNVTSSTATGTATVKPDCTGTLKYTTDNVTIEHQWVFSRASGEATSIFTKNPYAPTTMLCKLTPIVK